MKLSGIVKKYSGRGQKLGFPTANIEVSADAEEGVFLGYTRIRNSPSLPLFNQRGGRGEFLPSIIFIGAPETFGDEEKRLEAHILDFEDDLYGQEITVEIIHKLRDNRKFDRVEELVEQMKVDEEFARKFFGL